jgi:hypothetical protein
MLSKFCSKYTTNLEGGFYVIGEGPEYKPFCDLRSVPEAGRLREQVEIHGRASTHCSGPFPTESRPGVFSLFRNSDRLAGSIFPWSKGWQCRLAGTFHRRRSRFAENRFLQAGKAAENTNEKSRQCFA